MSWTKNYLLRVQEQFVGDEFPQFAQDAIEWAIFSNWVTLTGDFDTDIRAIMGEGGTNYDAIIVAYRKRKAELEQPVEMQMARALDPLFEQIAQPIRTTHENITTDLSGASGQRRTTPESPAEIRRVDLSTQV